MPQRLVRLSLVLSLLALFALPVSAQVVDEPEAYDVVVVGGGMGGLSAGALLSSYGFRVLLLEQHHKVGGCTTSFSRGDFRFDAALHEMLGGQPGSPLGGLLHEAGVDEKIDLIPSRCCIGPCSPGWTSPCLPTARPPSRPCARRGPRSAPAS